MSRCKDCLKHCVTVLLLILMHNVILRELLRNCDTVIPYLRDTVTCCACVDVLVKIQLMPCVGKPVTCAKCGKTCHWCQVRENLSPVPSAGKPVTGAKCGKVRVCQVSVGFRCTPDCVFA